MAASMQDIQTKAAQDEVFRAELLRDPRGALAGEGIQVPEEVELTVVEATPEHVTLVIPPHVSDLGELGEDALAGTSGGTITTIVFVTVTYCR
jgi:hypothetical protein